MQTSAFSLAGTWRFFDASRRNEADGTVPGCVHTDLNAAGRIGDLHWRDNEKDLLWIAEEDWTYERAFDLTGSNLLEHESVELVFEGLDTLAEDRLLGSRIMDYHQRSQAGSRVIQSYLAEWFLLPKNLEETLWAGQLLQALCVQYAAEHLPAITHHSSGRSKGRAGAPAK